MANPTSTPTNVRIFIELAVRVGVYSSSSRPCSFNSWQSMQ
jgi:hypothetical protein